MENYVDSTTLVRQAHWVAWVWPCHLKECQIKGMILLTEIKHSNVQMYCFVRVKNCYTTFHIGYLRLVSYFTLEETN